jgi:hypothetical protein
VRGTDRLTAREQPADRNTNGFFSAANFDRRTGADLPTTTQANFCSYSFFRAGNRTTEKTNNPQKLCSAGCLILLQHLLQIGVSGL